MTYVVMMCRVLLNFLLRDGQHNLLHWQVFRTE